MTTIQIEIVIHMLNINYEIRLFVCLRMRMSTQNNNHKTKHKNNTNCGSAFEPVPGFLITAPPSVCVPEVIGMLVWISNHTQKKKKDCVGLY